MWDYKGTFSVWDYKGKFFSILLKNSCFFLRKIFHNTRKLDLAYKHNVLFRFDLKFSYYTKRHALIIPPLTLSLTLSIGVD